MKWLFINFKLKILIVFSFYSLFPLIFFGEKFQRSSCFPYPLLPENQYVFARLSLLRLVCAAQVY